MAETKPANECTNPFVKIQGGPFQLGSLGRYAPSDEQPLRNVTISSFEVQQHEVSLGEVNRVNETAGKVLGAILSGCKGATPDAFLLRSSEVSPKVPCKSAPNKSLASYNVTLIPPSSANPR